MMSDVVAKGVIEVDIDPSGIKAGVAESKRSLADLTQAAEQSGQRAAKGIESIGAGGDRAARKVEQSTKSIIASIQRQIATMEAGSKNSSKYYEALANQRGVSAGVLRPYLDQLDAASVAQKRLGVTAGQAAQALHILPMQMTDVATSLASGQSPFLVLIQQGGQLKDSFGGVGPAAKAVGAYVAALVNPFSIAAAAVGVLALAYKEGSDEQTAFAKSIISTGNVSGVTTGQLAGMASQIDEQVGTTRQASAALAQLVGTGRIYGDQLQYLAQSAIAWERATGIAVEDTVKQFAELARDPVAASKKLNETYHFLTLTVYEQIKALEDQGRVQEAAIVAEQAYADALDDRAKEIEKSLGLIESGWKNVKSVAAEAWDEFLGIGRESTFDDQINKLGMLRKYANPQRRDEIDSELDALKTQKLIAEGNTRMWADERRVQQEGISAEATIAKLRDDSLSNAEKREKAIADYRANIEKIRAANPESALLAPERQSRDIANINEKYKDKEKGVTLANIGSTNDQLFDDLARKAEESSAVMREVAKSNEDYFKGISKSIDDARTNVSTISDFLLTDEQRLAQSYERRQGMLDQAHEYGLVSEEKYQQLKQDLEAKYTKDSLKVSDDYWDRYLAAAEESLTSFDELAGSTIETFSRGFGNAFEKVIFDSQTAGDAIKNLAEGMARSMVNALGQMAAQWLAYKAVEMMVGKTAQASAATALTANAQATALQAGIAAFASTAAIPIVGPALAPGAMAAALAVTEPMAMAVSTAALAGIAHAGIDNIPREGTWLLNGGERVVAPQQNRDLTRFLSNQSTTNNNQRNVTVNINGVTDYDSFRRSKRQVQDEMRKALNS